MPLHYHFSDGKIKTKIITKDANIHQEMALIDAVRYINQNVDEYIKDIENCEAAYIESIRDLRFYREGKIPKTT